MSRLRNYLDSIHPHFVKGGAFEKYYAIYEMVDTFLYTPKDVTSGSPHVRDALDLKRVMTYVFIAALPCALFGMWNTGHLANMAMADLGMTSLDSWRGLITDVVGYNADSMFANLIHGAMYYVPIYLVTLIVGGIWEVIFAVVRGHEVNEGFFVSSMLFSLILPATTPLWQVAIGISFGVVIGKEVFGGTGKNFLNPALTGRAFLYFAYPAQMSGDAIWTAVDGFSGATSLGIAAAGGVEAIIASGVTWSDQFLGTVQGSIGETSLVAILIGASFLLYTRIASFRIMLGVLAGMVITSTFFNLIGSDTNPMFAMPWYWHLVVGGFAFGAVYMATDPVSASMTNTGRWIFGGLIGVMTVLIRVVNPAFPEGIMLAILFANMFAPLIDYFVIQANIKRRVNRNV